MTRPTRPDVKRKTFWELQRPRYLLSGLVKCGVCGANYTKSGLHRSGCAAARDRATCTNHLTIRIEELEAAILAGLKQRLMEPPLFEEFVREFAAFQFGGALFDPSMSCFFVFFSFCIRGTRDVKIRSGLLIRLDPAVRSLDTLITAPPLKQSRSPTTDFT
jgi:hypothetical protein